MLCALVNIPIMAQSDYFSINGTVRDKQSGKKIAYVNVSTDGEHVSTVTNADGEFTFKTTKFPKRLVLSHLGYKTLYYPVNPQNTENLKLELTPSSIVLDEVVVTGGDPLEIIRAAIKKVPQNYSTTPNMYKGFYRETTQKRKKYIYVAEAVIDMYKSSYTHGVAQDAVSIIKGRRILNSQLTDTIVAKVQGGPTMPVFVDLVKNRDYILNEEDLAHYKFALLPPEQIGDKPQIVISMEPKTMAPYALYFAKIYVDRESMAFTRMELTLDVSDKDKANETVLVKKPFGLKFRLRDMKTTVNYKYDEDGTYRLSYIRNEMKFNCDWTRRLFHSAYTVVAEMVVTDYNKDEAKPIKSRDSFRVKDSFYDKVDSFNEPNFWGSYNIIEPTESLEHAINKLKKIMK
jgi:hypothetical protein